MYLESSLAEDRRPSYLAGVFGASLLLHLLFFVIAFILFQARMFTPSIEPKAKSIALQMVKIPPPVAIPIAQDLGNERLFADTAESIPTKQALPTPFEGETSTLASSTQKGSGNAALPSQTGVDMNGLTLRNQDYSPESIAKPQPQTQANEKQPPQEQAEPMEQVKKETAKLLPLNQNIPLRTSGLINVTDKVPPNPDSKKQEASKPSPNAATSQSIPAATFSAQKRAATINGGATIGDSASLGVQESEMGRYKAKLYRAIGSRWYIYIKENSAQVSVGIVKIRFKISSAGEISDLQTVQGDYNGALQAVSRRSIMELRGQLDPFPLSMQEQLGDFYWEEVTFTIY